MLAADRAVREHQDLVTSLVCASVSKTCCAADTKEAPLDYGEWTHILDHTSPGWFLLKWAVRSFPEREWRHVVGQRLPVFAPRYGYGVQRAAVQSRYGQPMKENAVAFYASVITSS